MGTYHNPVLLRESVSALALHQSDVCVDATFGGGGHSRAILDALGPDGKLIAFDQDADAVQNSINDSRFSLVRSNFRFVHNQCKYLGYPQVDAIFADLGVSSHQFDTAQRGFSFRFEGPLDMRMNTSSSLTAEKVLNTYSAEDLANVFYLYGELENSRAMARAITNGREKASIDTSTQLEEILKGCIPPQARAKYLAKVYQALRIEVNGEIRALEQFLEQSFCLLKEGGRMVVITYHSLEDRPVKNFLRSGNVLGSIQADEIKGGSQKYFTLINKKPLLPSEEEIQANPRARSAKLRAAIKTTME